MPGEILARRSKGDYSAAEYAGLRAHHRVVRRLLAEPLLADLGVVEPVRVTGAVERAVAGLRAPMGALAEVIAAEIWLRAVHERSAVSI